MKIRIDDIPEGGYTIDAEASKSDWFKTVIDEVFGPNHLKKDDWARVNLQLFRHNKRDVNIIGGIILKVHLNCDRCTVEFEKQQQIPVSMLMIPSPKTFEKQGKNEEEIAVDDEDLSFYEGDEIDVSLIVREQLILSQKMVNWCKDDCKGLCPKCGKNLNAGGCKCKIDDKTESPFAVLKKIGA